MAEAQPKILVVEDDLEVAEMLNAYFRVQGYEVFTVNWGEDGVRVCQESGPDVVLLDIRLPDIDGYEVARRLRANRKTASIPIIFLTEKRERNERLQGLELGADDYITKPFDVQELRLRIRNALRRARQDHLTHPITGLPDGTAVDERLGQCLEAEGWALVLIAVENLDSFREAYGFVASDDVLRAVSLIAINVLTESGRAQDFLGHLGTTQLVLVTDPGQASGILERIRARLDQSMGYFYPIKDREQAAQDGTPLAVRLGLFDPGGPVKSSLEALKASLAQTIQ